MLIIIVVVMMIAVVAVIQKKKKENSDIVGNAGGETGCWVICVLQLMVLTIHHVVFAFMDVKDS